MKANKEPMDSSASKGTLTRAPVEEMRAQSRARFNARVGKPFSRRTLALEKRLKSKLGEA